MVWSSFRCSKLPWQGGSLLVDAGLLDHHAPLGGVGDEYLAQRLGRARARLHAELDELLLHVGQRDSALAISALSRATTAGWRASAGATMPFHESDSNLVEPRRCRSRQWWAPQGRKGSRFGELVAMALMPPCLTCPMTPVTVSKPAWMSPACSDEMTSPVDLKGTIGTFSFGGGREELRRQVLRAAGVDGAEVEARRVPASRWRRTSATDFIGLSFVGDEQDSRRCRASRSSRSSSTGS